MDGSGFKNPDSFHVPLTIPRIVMQTWKTTSIPEHWKPSVLSVQKYMSHWTYCLMTDVMNRNFVKDHFPKFLAIYDAFKYNIQRVDAVRYMWLYQYGGLYMDLDIQLLGNIDHMFTEGSVFLVSSANVSSVVTNSFMASKPNQNIWLRMLAEMAKPVPWYHIDKFTYVLYSTGPCALTRVLQKTKEPVVLLPKEVMNPYAQTVKVFDKQHALTKPLRGGSWYGPERIFVTKPWLAPAMVIGLIVIVYILVKMMSRKKIPLIV